MAPNSLVAVPQVPTSLRDGFQLHMMGLETFEKGDLDLLPDGTYKRAEVRSRWFIWKSEAWRRSLKALACLDHRAGTN